MKTCTKCLEEKPEALFAPRPESKSGYRPFCIECRKRKAASYRELNKEKVAAYLAEYNRTNNEQISQKKAVYREKTKDAQARRNRDYYLKHKERLNAQSSAYHSANKEEMNTKNAKWRRENLHKRGAADARRKAAKLQATPGWADSFLIEEIYDLSIKRKSYTGIDWHVDHIVPLQSHLVCGLHCEANLRVIPGIENISKRNRHWPDMPGILNMRFENERA